MYQQAPPAGRRPAGLGACTLVVAATMAVSGCTSGHRSSAVPAPSARASSSLPASTDRSAASARPSVQSGELPIRYLVVPHPDDEFAIWSMAQDRAHFPVLVVLTHGEKSGSCAGGGLQAADGERAPSPQPFAGRLTASCEAERLDSLLAFLGDVSSLDTRWKVLTEGPPGTGPPPAVSPGPQRCDAPSSCVPATGYRIWTGVNAALLVFDLGDHDVNPAEVNWAIQTARSLRSSFAPADSEDDVVGMGYTNTTDHAFAPYDHPDQQAVAATMMHTDLGLPGPQWSRTYPSDPARAMTAKVDPVLFTAVTAVSPGPVDPAANPHARRTGALQVDYGWLAFPGAYWYAEPEPVHSFYSQSQDFTASY